MLAGTAISNHLFRELRILNTLHLLELVIRLSQYNKQFQKHTVIVHQSVSIVH